MLYIENAVLSNDTIEFIYVGNHGKAVGALARPGELCGAQGRHWGLWGAQEKLWEPCWSYGSFGKAPQPIVYSI